MLTKEECKEAVSILKDQHEYLSFNLRANYPFSIEMIREVQDCFEQLIKEHFNPQPYKFEDLKPGMWIWDDKLKIPYKIKKMMHCHWFKAEYRSFVLDAKTEERKYHTGIMEFEENRFFPITKAMEYQE